ncbi:MAG: hypothetical protein H3C35_02435 [Bacteroidetes bacterium]|nr:hypothetical protein [Bacteroidota bacterium]
MNAKKMMFESIDQLAIDLLKLQDIIIELRRESEEIHVTSEHTAKLATMKEQLQIVQTKLESMQDFVVSCQRRAEHPPVLSSSHSDVWL